MDEVVVGASLLVAAVVCGTSIVVPQRLRPAAHTVVVLAAGAIAWSVGVSVAEVALIVVVLALLAVTSTMMEAHVVTTRAEQRRAEEAADRRTALLAAARDIADLDVEEAAAVALRSLRELGFEGAGIAIVRDGMLMPVRLDNLPVAATGPVPVTEGVAGRAVRRRETQYVADYREDPDRLNDGDGAGMMAVSPIVVRGEVVGAVAGLSSVAGPPSESQREAIEVITGHLGAAFDNRHRVENQRLLLERMDRLDAMRTGFVDQVSDELRDPLTVVRGAGHTLRSHGSTLPADARTKLIDRLCSQADALQRIVDVVLDFSRFQAAHQLSERHWVSLRTVVEPFADRIDQAPELPEEQDGGPHVHVDAELLRYALALLLDETSATCRMRADDREAVLTIDGALEEWSPLTRSLIEQLVLESGAALQGSDPVTIRLPRFDMAQEVRL